MARVTLKGHVPLLYNNFRVPPAFPTLWRSVADPDHFSTCDYAFWDRWCGYELAWGFQQMQEPTFLCQAAVLSHQFNKLHPSSTEGDCNDSDHRCKWKRWA